MTTRLAGGMFSPYKGIIPACARKAHWSLLTAPHLQQPLTGAFSVLPYIGTAPKGACWFALPSYLRSKRFIYCVSSPAHPWTGRYTLLSTSDHTADPLSTDSEYTLWSLQYFYRLYLHNILDTRNVYFHIYISDLHGVRISWANFFLWDIPLFLILNILVEFARAYVYDLDNILLR